MAEVAKEKYSTSELKEELELLITNLRIEEESKGEKLTKEDLPKLNSDEIDVGSTESFPVGIIFNKYKFSVDENFIVTYVGEADGTIVTYTTDPEGYTNKDEVKILIKISNPKGIKSIEYPDGDKLELNGNTEIGVDYTVTANGTYTFLIIDNEDNVAIKDIVIYKIDKIAPDEFTIRAEDITENSFTVIAETSDNLEIEESITSGIEKYEYYVKEKSETEYTKYIENQIQGLTGKIYDVYVLCYDRAGNITKSNEINIKMKIETPELTRKTPGYMILTENGIIGNAKVEIQYNNDSNVKNYYSIDDGATWIEVSGSTYYYETNDKNITQISAKTINEDGEEKIASLNLYEEFCYTGSTRVGYYNIGEKREEYYILIDENIIGRTLNVEWSGAICVSSVEATIIFYSEDGTSIKEQCVGSIYGNVPNGYSTSQQSTVEIPEGAYKIGVEFYIENAYKPKSFVYSEVSMEVEQ